MDQTARSRPTRGTSTTASPAEDEHNFRPAPTRAASLHSFNFKTRAASQPAGERLPAPSSPSPSNPGRGSPIIVDKFGVIGGSRAPGRFAGALAVGSGTQTRASSFSVGDPRDARNAALGRTLSSHTEEHPSRTSSTSPYPTFSPSSSPATSPRVEHAGLHHSPPKAVAGVSRSRSHSLAAVHRPDRNLIMPMSSMDQPFRTFDKGWDTSPPEAGTHSPFSRQQPSFGEASGQTPVQRFKPHDFRSWSGSGDNALSHSVAHALGGVQTNAHTGFEGGGRSGASSRRHSVSVVGGGFGRRDFFESGQGMSMVSPPALGRGNGYDDTELLLPDQLNNALSLEIDQSRRRGVEIEINQSRSPQNALGSSLPFDRSFGLRKDPFAPEGTYGLGSSPARGRMAHQANTQPGSDSKATRAESRDGSKSRFSFENQPAAGSPGRYSDITKGSPDTTGAIGPAMGIPRQAPPPAGPGAIGAPSPSYDTRYFQAQQQQQQQMQQMQYGAGSGGFYRPQMQMQMPYQGPASPINPYAYTRPNAGAYPFYPRPPPGVPPNMAYPPTYPSAFSPPPPSIPYSPAPQSYPPSFFPSSPTPSTLPLPGSTSPSFSSLSLSDLGRGLALTSLAPSTPLYVVLFKAGRRDVYYCPDPTLLISNNDRVIVEADRGSDLGTVVFDQLTPVDVREWQERQATAALLSGASQHMPPGMAVGAAAAGGAGGAVAGNVGSGSAGSTNGPGAQSQSQGSGPGQRVKEGELRGADLNQLLSGCGPSGNAFDSGVGMVQRGPLAKEIMPKRIFAKSAQGPDEQARMLEKRKDEYEAMMICREKVMERGLPMQIVDAEYQWDRRKLTFYFKADRRVDFRELTKENFRIFKSRIWMSMVAKDDPR